MWSLFACATTPCMFQLTKTLVLCVSINHCPFRIRKKTMPFYQMCIAITKNPKCTTDFLSYSIILIQCAMHANL
jgi:hypothetical protein